MKQLVLRALVLLSLIHSSFSYVSAESGGRTNERPNILFCFADDWGWPHAGVYGDKVVETPSFDRLAREGVLFTHAYVSSPSCTPSRNAILTGQQFYRLGEGANLHSTLDIRHPNFVTLLKDAGYEVAHSRKAWGPGDFKVGGYEDESPCGPGMAFAKFMEERKSGIPFCFWFGTSDPHRPYEPGTGRGSGMELEKVEVPSFWPDTETVRSDIADYYWEVQRWDREVAAAIALVEKAGELENTIIVMSGDHGMPFPRCKGNLYDSGVRVPLAIRWGKKVPGGRSCERFVSLTDLAPTFLEAAGVQIPGAMTGRSLLPLLNNSSSTTAESPAEDFIVFGRERHTPAQASPSMAGYPSRGIRTERWLLILNLEPDRWPAGVPEGASHPMNNFSDCDSGPTKLEIIENRDQQGFETSFQLCFAKRPAVELYDCQADPYQVKNLASEPAKKETVETLRRRLIEYLEATDDPRFTAAPVEFDEYPYRAKYALSHDKDTHEGNGL